MSFAAKGAEIDDPSLLNLRRGADGWFYSWSKGLTAREQGTSSFDSAQLRIFFEDLDSRAARVEANGARYVFSISPDKTTIYPEHLPSDIRFLSASYLDQLQPMLATRPYVVDLVGPLLAAKAYRQVYFKTDSHWNFEAGRIAAESLLQKLGQPALTGHDVVGAEVTQIMDLGRYADPVALETFTKYTEAKPPRYRCLYSSKAVAKLKVQVFEGNNRSAPTCVMFRDSYSSFFVNYLLARFSRIVLAATREYCDDLVQSERPDVVVTQIAERYVNVIRRDHSAASFETSFGVDVDFIRRQRSY